ncbi:2Fe-2S iron-sulfur cluster-binding protein [Sphingopyxis terrae]|uniref:2Fe-2S iron-sulfur cluster-binding protein n=1 Tax=Sphingopyxis terrae TaxID=33052 RepID=UPI002A17FA16|nr:2Fe-2S iron-sulfur cluster-binding protein [Sphingopyxis terrae]MDX8356409.1 2Fe-2S iron-sulfur cluster-binding protein [Sphingopyxis terrae]
MPKVKFIEADGHVLEVDVDVGCSVMEAARQADIPSISADCGGACSCATCHVYVAPAWRARIGEPNALEADMLETVDNPGEGSRLSCQIVVTQELDGIECLVPAS